ncbi:MAG: thioredoxin-disulfide reductase [Propionibacteriaceae bacterium]|jgi:thioredoxin reductase (NADPH)|nr:thioredoxin-disulfide reductase [Propionibacteriaceae bacterium]
MQIRNVIIIGSGPAGYTAAIYSARAGLQPLLFEGALNAGGMLMNTSEIENFPGFPSGIGGPDLMAKLREQAESFGTEFITDDVERVDLVSEVKRVWSATGEEYEAWSVILAMGSAYRQLNIPAETSYAGKGVSWCATCDGFFYRGKEIAVIGGGDTALEEAMFLTRFADKVTLIHRRDEFRASHIMIERLRANSKIVPIMNSEVVDMSGNTKLAGLTLRDTVTGALTELSVSGLFEAIGHTPRSELVAGQIELTADGYVKVSAPSTATNLPGVFAAGDLTDPTYRQAISAAGTGCRAAIDTERYLVVTAAN